jgi:hypothetical protein
LECAVLFWRNFPTDYGSCNPGLHGAGADTFDVKSI